MNKEAVIIAMGISGQPMICAISDPEVVKLINEELGSNFVPGNAKAMLDESAEDSWVIAEVTDGKINWFSAWTE